MQETQKLLDIAKLAAYEAGKIHLKHYEKEKDISQKSNEFDLVTNVDKMSEEKIISILSKNFPDHSILCEESGKHQTRDSDYVWVIDPIDGTTNYTHNFPHFAVSIGLVYKNEYYLGVVYDSFKDELFGATKGNGSFLNDKPIQVSSTDNLRQSLLATGFPYIKTGLGQENLKYFTKFLFEAQAIRRPGAAALDLCYIACGRLDGFWELGLSPWDTAAGICIIREAGGKVTNFDSEDFDMYNKTVLASNGKIQDKMMNIIKSCQ